MVMICLGVNVTDVENLDIVKRIVQKIIEAEAQKKIAVVEVAHQEAETKISIENSITIILQHILNKFSIFDKYPSLISYHTCVCIRDNYKFTN